jgi:hypothetical protein
MMYCQRNEGSTAQGVLECAHGKCVPGHHPTACERAKEMAAINREEGDKLLFDSSLGAEVLVQRVIIPLTANREYCPC